MFKVIGISALVVVLFIVATVVIMLVWAWVMPDIFSGAVEHGLLPASITFVQALKLSVLLAVLGVTGRSTK